jgi:outer membrane protein assembly factor BamA
LTAFFLPVLAFALGSCTKTVPRESLPYPLTNDSFDEQVKVVTVPLPVIGSTPNEGVTLGALSAFLLHNRNDEVSTLVAPQINYNKNFGVTGALYGALYPEPGHSWEMNIAKSSNVNEDYEVRFIDRHLTEKTDLNAFFYFLTDGSARFFGFQSTSLKENETNYGDHETGITLLAGYDLAEHLQLILGERVRNVRIVEGAVKGIPFIRDRFTEEQVPGIDGFFTHAQRLGIAYTTLNSLTFPTQGSQTTASAEFSSSALGSSDNYRHYEIEHKSYFPLGEDDRFISIIRAMYNQTLGSNVPFLERSILGGETTLRGYGRNRFIDSSYLLINLEERIRLLRWTVFNVNADWEAAPFVDVGAVAKSLLRTRSKNLEYNPGIGFRAVVKPNIVGRVDVGFGNEGPAVFVGLNYPF